jgi:hypothetical protein
MTQFDEASIAKLKVVELKQELEKLNVEIPKGNFTTTRTTR